MGEDNRATLTREKRGLTLQINGFLCSHGPCWIVAMICNRGHQQRSKETIQNMEKGERKSTYHSRHPSLTSSTGSLIYAALEEDENRGVVRKYCQRSVFLMKKYNRLES